MKNRPGVRFLGLVFIILSSLGLLFSVGGIVITWAIKPEVQNGIYDYVDSLSHILTTTDESFYVMNDTIEDTKGNLVVITTTIENLDDTIEDISLSLISSASLVGGDMRLTLLDTQIALSSAASSSKIIDDTLSLLAAIPLLGADYRPEVPLHISLERVANSLEDIPEALESIDDKLNDTAVGINTLNSDLNEFANNIHDFEDNLSDAQAVLAEYLEITSELREQTIAFRDNSPRNLTILSIIITGGFFWLGVAQINVFMQGYIFLHGQQHVVNLADIQRD